MPRKSRRKSRSPKRYLSPRMSSRRVSSPRMFSRISNMGFSNPRRVSSPRMSSQRMSNMGFSNPQTEHWELYTMEGCGHCTKAKDLLKARINSKIKVDIIPGENNNALKQKMKQAGKQDYNTWPKIFLNNEFIGGYSDLQSIIS
jgi:glutaredoxin